jgi:hypothetical protein
LFQRFQSIMSGRLWHGRAAHIMVARKQSEKRSVLTGFLLFSLLLHPDILLSLLWVGVTQIQGESSPLVNPLWKHPHGHTQTCAPRCSYVFLNQIESIIKINHDNLVITCQLDTKTHLSPSLIIFQAWSPKCMFIS